MEAKCEDLTAAESRYSEHAERAQSQGRTLAEDCRRMGLCPHVLYSARRQLKLKGILGQTRKRQRVSGKPSQFLAVSVAQPVGADVPQGVVYES